MLWFERTDLDGGVPGEVEGLLSVLIRSGPQRHHHQVPPHCYIVAPNSDTWRTGMHFNTLTNLSPLNCIEYESRCLRGCKCLPSPTVWWTTLSSTVSPSVPKTPMAGEKPSWKAQPWMYESSPETFNTGKKIQYLFYIFTKVTDTFKSDQDLVATWAHLFM